MARKNKPVSSLNYLLSSVERLFLNIIIGLVAPIILMLAGWWGSLPFVPEGSIMYFALGGLLLGLLVDVLFLRRWVRKAYSFPVAWFVLVYLFYSVCLFGFFMGMPAFNLVMGVMGGYYTGLCLRHANRDQAAVEITARRTALFAAVVLGAVCLASWVLAYQEATIASEIKGMFSLKKEISRETILGLSAAAGIGLVVIEYYLTRAMVRFARFM
jgi:hypothetical protein